MEPIFQQDFTLTQAYVDCFGRIRPSMLLYIAQEIAGQHCLALSLDAENLARRRLFWAVTRHRVQITRQPSAGETIHVETWPMPTTRVAYPRSVVAYGQDGQECFRSISLWVLMDLDSRNMILPGKSGIAVVGTVRGTELPSPAGLIAKDLEKTASRQVRFSDLDRNGHMNNTRYLDWIDDLFPSALHAQKVLKDMTVCYLNEAREGQQLDMQWDFLDGDTLQVDAHRTLGNVTNRVFSARLTYQAAPDRAVPGDQAAPGGELEADSVG